MFSLVSNHIKKESTGGAGPLPQSPTCFYSSPEGTNQTLRQGLWCFLCVFIGLTSLLDTTKYYTLDLQVYLQ